jgi:hypothetical protein
MGIAMVRLAGVGVAIATATLYAMLHSPLASDEAQAMARCMFRPRADRWYRLAYNALAIVTLVPLEPRRLQGREHSLYVEYSGNSWRGSQGLCLRGVRRTPMALRL